MPYKNPEQQREFQRRWMQQRRASYLCGKKCARCGSGENLELDHVDPGSKVSHRIWSWSAKKRDAELARCQILCGPCHREKTAADMGYGGHGRQSRYNHGCRCSACRQAHTECARRYRARVKAGIQRKRKSITRP